MSYYNSVLAVWEPIIEPNERRLASGLVEYVPWQVKFSLDIDKGLDDTNATATTADVPEPKTRILITSSESLELTATKTCLDVLQDLSASFSTALSDEGLRRPEHISPFVVTNDTGFEVTLTLRGTPFTVQEHGDQQQHRPTLVDLRADVATTATTRRVDVVTLPPGEQTRLQLVAHTDQSVGTLSPSAQTAELFVGVRIGNINKEIYVPVHKADRRYFPLYRDTKQEPWGIISHVRSEYGSTLVTLHGVLQLHNHFSTPVFVWRRHANGQLLAVGSVAPDAVFNVPLHALYAERKDLFFSLAGYKTSVQGMNWTENTSDYGYTKLLQCDPERTFEPFYMMATRERHEIYHEITSKHTMLSAYYVIHLRPPLYVRNALPLSLHVSVAGCSVEIANLVESGTEAGESMGSSSEANAAPAQGPLVVDGSRDSELKRAVLSHERIEQQIDFLDYGEKEVKPGDILHLPTVKMMVKEGENRSYIVARVRWEWLLISSWIITM